MSQRTPLRMMVSFALLCVVCVVMVLHPFVPHQHGGEHIVGVSFVTAHTGMTERSEGEVVFWSTLLLVASASAVYKLWFALKQRGLQHVDIPIRLALHLALMKGIIHARPYHGGGVV